MKSMLLKNVVSWIWLLMICILGSQNIYAQVIDIHNRDRKVTQTYSISAPDGYIENHGYVDLGLPSGTKWAICNVGSDAPEKRGAFISWGENNKTFPYSIRNTKLYGERVTSIAGNINYDAATANWGESWSTPTKGQYEELFTNCKWEWTKYNGVLGTKLTSPNGKSIFLPAYGYAEGIYQNEELSYHSGTGPWCAYWTATAESAENACSVHSSVTGACTIYRSKFAGFLIRPVLSK